MRIGSTLMPLAIFQSFLVNVLTTWALVLVSLS